jgi:ethanolamine-phosphate cytidylyltransferase
MVWVGYLACKVTTENGLWLVFLQITTFNISLVVHGTCAEVNEQKNGERDPYAAAKEMGIFTVIESPRNMTTSTIIQRILTNHEAYKKRNEKKVKSEKNYYESKTFVNGD